MLRNALDGLTVLDLTQIGAGPTCTMMLADMGARVIKVEARGGEIGRTLGPGWIGEDAALFQGFNRNKLGVSIDLKADEGKAVLRTLMAQADVFIESMRPGVMHRLGLGYEDVRENLPDLVYCSISAYGQTGPYAQRAGVDGVLQADSGLMGLIGIEGCEPCKVQAPVVDVTTGYIAAMAVMAKLIQRGRDGAGGHLDVSLMNSAMALQQSSLSNYFADGVLPIRVGSAAPYSAPNQAFPTKDGWIMIAAYSPQRWATFCELIGRQDIACDDRFATSPLRVEHREEMVAVVSEALRQHNTQHWLDLFEPADILCSRVSTYDDLVRHPQVLASGMLTSVEHPVHGTLRMPGFPVNSEQSNAARHEPAPRCGQHTRLVLRDAGYSDAQIDALQASGAVLCA